MPHIDPENLALMALGEADDEQHLAECSVCAAELAELRRVVDLGRSSEEIPLSTPPDAVWRRIEDELGFEHRPIDGPASTDAAPSADAGAEAPEHVAPPAPSPDARTEAPEHVPPPTPPPDAGAEAPEHVSPPAPSPHTGTQAPEHVAPPAPPIGSTPQAAPESTTTLDSSDTPGASPSAGAPPSATATPSPGPAPTAAPSPTATPSPGPASTTAPSPSTTPTRRPRPRRARRGRARIAWALAAAVALVAAIGVTGWLVGTQGTDQQQIAAATLDAFPAHPDAVGSANVLETPDGSRMLEVHLEHSPPGDGYREVWLIDAQNSALISLGILQGDTGDFIIPPGVDLEAYNFVDVSVEPVDGDPQHSGDSIVRGPLQFG